jgi:hypothetical protein
VASVKGGGVPGDGGYGADGLRGARRVRSLMVGHISVAGPR